MDINSVFWTILFPALSGAISWLATRYYERGKQRAETATLNIGNTRQEIENYKLISIEWREAAQQWKDLVDEYQAKLIENAKRIEELYDQNAQLRREFASVKGQLTRANNRIKELEDKESLRHD